jgi:aspartate kinase
MYGEDSMRVMKFGGTSVGTGAAISQTARILAAAHREGRPMIGVVSAMAGITNLLLESASAAASGDAEASAMLSSALLDRHLGAIDEVIGDPGRREVTSTTIRGLVERCIRLVESVHVLGDLSPRGTDWIVSFGERMSVVILAGALDELGVAAEPVNADRIIVTDEVFGSAEPLLDKTRTMAQATLGPLLDRGVLPVVTGFFGATEDGATTTLGRGGSDYSAAILANALSADEVWIWTDVDGVMTADPRLVPGARTLPAVSFAEATELAYFGAKVIHSPTMRPAAECGIPIWIKNTFRPERPGTRIGPEPTENGSVKAITAIPGLSVITVEGSGFLGVAGVTARVFSVLGRAGINVFMISQASSQHSLSFVVRGTDGPRVVRLLTTEFEFDLLRERVLQITEDPGRAIIAVVGGGMRGTPGVAGRVFQTLGSEGINIAAIAQGSSELNISFVVAEPEIARAVPVLHQAFKLGDPPAR